MYIEKDCGHKRYALFNEPLRDMTKEGMIHEQEDQRGGQLNLKSISM
jgi:hypothetical protein